MTIRDRYAQRAQFLRALLHGVYVTWPILSALLVFQLVLGAVIGLREGWGLGDGIYFACVTGLTIGYGDLAPTTLLTRVLAIAVGFSGIVLTGVVAAIAVGALQATVSHKH